MNIFGQNEIRIVSTLQRFHSNHEFLNKSSIFIDRLDQSELITSNVHTYCHVIKKTQPFEVGSILVVVAIVYIYTTMFRSQYLTKYRFSGKLFDSNI